LGRKRSGILDSRSEQGICLIRSGCNAESAERKEEERRSYKGKKGCGPRRDRILSFRNTKKNPEGRGGFWGGGGTRGTDLFGGGTSLC